MRRILLRTLATLVVLVLAFVGFVYIRSEIALRSTWHIDEPALTIPGDSDARARGEHVAITRGCTECHAADLGGHVVFESPPIGRMGAPNLTRGRGGVVASYDARTWERAIRHGVRHDNRSLLFMPARDFAVLSDADTADLIAYLQGVPPVDRDSIPSYVGPVGRALFAFGKLPMVEARLIDQHARHPARLEIAATADYGRYLAQTCTGCHGEGMSGGPIPGTPPNFPKPPNLTPDATGLADWTKADFYRVFREGKKRDGSALDTFMPWQSMSRFTDTELDALWAYLRSLPPRPAGQR
jgi:mono/diheme cytochrome c family protein